MSADQAQPATPVQDWSARFEQLAAQARHGQLQAFYQAGVVTAQTPIEDVELLALDVETTGLNAQEHSIVSIGLIPFNLKRIRCGAARYWVVNPSTDLNGNSVTFHRITHSDIREAPALADVLPELLQAMAGKVMVVHYRHLERAFLDQALHQYLGEGIEFPVLDTMQLEARLHRKPRGWFARLFGRAQQSIRLAESRERYNLPAYHGHHALTDALATAELLQAQIATSYSAEIPIAELWY